MCFDACVHSVNVAKWWGIHSNSYCNISQNGPIYISISMQSHPLPSTCFHLHLSFISIISNYPKAKIEVLSLGRRIWSSRSLPLSYVLWFSISTLRPTLTPMVSTILEKYLKVTLPYEVVLGTSFMIHWFGGSIHHFRISTDCDLSFKYIPHFSLSICRALHPYPKTIVS